MDSGQWTYEIFIGHRSRGRKVVSSRTSEDEMVVISREIMALRVAFPKKRISVKIWNGQGKRVNPPPQLGFWESISAIFRRIFGF